jgi:hypothetical protein
MWKRTAAAGLSFSTAFQLQSHRSLVSRVLGLYGALSDARELGVCLAFAAQRHHIILQVLQEGARLARAGIVTDLAAWAMVSRIVTGIAPAGAAPPWWSWLAAPSVLAAAVVIAGILPDRRALLVDPDIIMRES